MIAAFGLWGLQVGHQIGEHLRVYASVPEVRASIMCQLGF